METYYYICNCASDLVMRFFETLFLDEVSNLFSKLDFKTIRKILYNIDLVLAFWDKTSEIKTLVIATHGFIKKVDKIPNKEIDKAINLRNKYFINKPTSNDK